MVPLVRFFFWHCACIAAALTLGCALEPGPPTVDVESVWIDSVTRGSMNMNVRGPGSLIPSSGKESAGHSAAILRIAEFQIGQVKIGQDAEIETRFGVLKGRVTRVDESVSEGTRRVSVELRDEPPLDVGPNATVDGTILTGKLDNVLSVARPVYSFGKSELEVFVVQDDGRTAVRTRVMAGAASLDRIEIRSGLREGDRVIVSDMSAYDSFDRIRLNKTIN